MLKVTAAVNGRHLRVSTLSERMREMESTACCHCCCAIATSSGHAQSSGLSRTCEKALPGTVVGTNPEGSVNLDIAVSADGAYLYSLNGRSGAIGCSRSSRTDG